MKGEAPTHPLEKAVAIYTDGGLLSSNPSTIGGSWAWVAVSDDNRKLGFKSGIVLCQRGIPVSNNHTEQIAMVKAIEALPFGWSGTIYSDSEVCITRVKSDYELNTLGIKRYPAGEKNLWPSISRRSKEAVKKLGQVRFVLVQGHPTKADLLRGIGAKRNLPVSEWNVWCDKRCNYEKAKYVKAQVAALDAEVAYATA